MLGVRSDAKENDTILQENRQCSKVISSSFQSMERRILVHQKRLVQYNEQLHLNENEGQDYLVNVSFKSRLFNIASKALLNSETVTSQSEKVNKHTII